MLWLCVQGKGRRAETRQVKSRPERTNKRQRSAIDNLHSLLHSLFVVIIFVVIILPLVLYLLSSLVNVLASFHCLVHTRLAQFNFENQLDVQLDWAPSKHTRKINFPTNRKGYYKSETTIEKFSTRKTQIFQIYFAVIFYWPLIFKTSKHITLTKIEPANLDSPHRILVCRGLRPFWGVSVCWEIKFLVS